MQLPPLVTLVPKPPADIICRLELPFKMAYTKEQHRIYRRGYEAGLRAGSPEWREATKERKHQLYQKHILKMRSKAEKANRKAGLHPWPKGPRSKAEHHVGTSKRWRIIDGRIYFTSKRGFEPGELREILLSLKK